MGRKKKTIRFKEGDFNNLVKMGFGPISPPQQKQLENLFYEYGKKKGGKNEVDSDCNL